jgi:alpha-tubulin suppressor-like RCC1 family protein
MAILNSLMMTATGSGDTCEALEGTMWTWGYGQVFGNGQGDALTTNRSDPTQLGSGTNWTNNVGNYKSPANVYHLIKSDGTLWGWGENTNGGVGDSTTTDRCSPVQVGALTDWAQVADSTSWAIAIKTDGTLWSWGKNVYGYLGHGDDTERSSPTQVGSLTDWASVDVGAYHCIALKTDGTMWGWGFGSKGEVGHGSTTSPQSPVQIGSATDWIAIECYTFSSRALASV